MTEEKWTNTYDDLYEFVLERKLREQIYIEGFKAGWANAHTLFMSPCERGPAPDNIPDKVLFGKLKDFNNE